VLAAVSFLTDVASEMIYPLLPLFLSGTLGVSATVLGAIEGAAESVSSLLRLPAGWISDKLGRRKPLVVFGYTLAAIARPLVGLAQSAGVVLAIRLTDRFGKGVRSAPRDALIADSVTANQRGYAYGLHRAADSLGAVFGPLIAWAVLSVGLLDMRALFLWAAVPGLIAVVLVIGFVREVQPRPRPGEIPAPEQTEESVALQVTNGANGATKANEANEAKAAKAAKAAKGGKGTKGAKGDAARGKADDALGAPFWRYLGVLFVFTLSNSTDAFLLLRASQLGVPTALTPILWAMLHVVKSSSSIVGGALSDRIGRRPLIIAGWTVFAVCYLALSLATAQWHAWGIFLVYGLYFGMTEGTEKALVADFVPASRRGTAFGWFNATLGLGALPASVLFGVVWERAGAETAFLMGAGIALLAMIAFALIVAPRGTRAG
jgi:MFS family permease